MCLHLGSLHRVSNSNNISNHQRLWSFIPQTTLWFGAHQQLITQLRPHTINSKGLSLSMSPQWTRRTFVYFKMFFYMWLNYKGGLGERTSNVWNTNREKHINWSPLQLHLWKKYGTSRLGNIKHFHCLFCHYGNDHITGSYMQRCCQTPPRFNHTDSAPAHYNLFTQCVKIDTRGSRDSYCVDEHCSVAQQFSCDQHPQVSSDTLKCLI